MLIYYVLIGIVAGALTNITRPKKSGSGFRRVVAAWDRAMIVRTPTEGRT